jgi:cephalosporin hydroxylase
MHDDRTEFAELQREYSRQLHDDVTLQRLSLEATRQADLSNYSYVWSWLGLPIIQMPTDVVAMQEVIWSRRPQVIVETGVARGGSVILHSSILSLIGEGRVVAVDIDIRAHNREAIESHPLASRVELLEGSSTDPRTLERVREAIGGAERVMVALDSNHTHAHVLEELQLYAPLVTPGQFLVVSDTFVEQLDSHSGRPRPWGPGDNPGTAVEAFLRTTDRFVRDADINSKLLMSSAPGGYLRCVR